MASGSTRCPAVGSPIQCKSSAVPLSSNSDSKVSMSGSGANRLPSGHHREQGGRLPDGLQLLAHRRLRQHLSQLGQDLQMLLGRVLGNQQHHQQPDRLTVRGTELDRVLYPDDRRGCPLQSAQAPVRYRDSLAQAGRTELLAGHQAVEDSRRTQSLIMLEYVSCTVQRVALVVRLDVQRDVRKRQQVREQIHGRSTPFRSRLHSFEQRTRNRDRGYLRWATVLPLSLPLLPT